MSSSNRNSTVGGLSIAHARKIAKHALGPHLDKVVHNINNTTFDIYIYEGADPSDVEKLEKWTEFSLLIVSVKPKPKSKKSIN